MNEALTLELPFYLPEVVDRLVQPVIPDLVNRQFPAAALENRAYCEALNQALEASIGGAE